MSKEKDPAILLYTKDILTSCDDWTDEEFGCYCRLLFSSHVNDGLTNDIKRLRRISDSIEANKDLVLQKFFVDDDGKLRNERLEKERQKRADFSKSQKWNATKSVIIRSIKNNPALVEKFKSEVKNLDWKNIKIADFETNLTDLLTKLSTNQPADRQPNRLEPRVQHIGNENGNAIENGIVKEDEKKESEVFAEIVNDYHTQCPDMPKVMRLTRDRKTHIRARLRDDGRQKVYEVICKAGNSDFLNGKNEKGWKATLDWLIKPNNFIKVLEGKYDNGEGFTNPTKTGNSGRQFSPENMFRAMEEKGYDTSRLKQNNPGRPTG